MSLCESVLDQDGVLTSAQATALYGRAFVRAQVAARRWQHPVRGVVVVHNGPLTESQRAWVALLGCPRGAALGGFTALGFDGFTGFEAERPTVVIPHDADRPDRPDVRLFCSTMLDERDVHPLRQPRRVRPQRGIVDEASWTLNPRYARAIVLAGAQQRLVGTRHMRDALARRGPCRHRALIVESILDAAGGVQSLPERDFQTIWRTRRLPPPTSQAVRRRPDGTYYLDAAWFDYDAACEIHGIPHMRVMCSGTATCSAPTRWSCPDLGCSSSARTRCGASRRW